MKTLRKECTCLRNFSRLLALFSFPKGNTQLRDNGRSLLPFFWHFFLPLFFLSHCSSYFNFINVFPIKLAFYRLYSSPKTGKFSYRIHILPIRTENKYPITDIFSIWTDLTLLPTLFIGNEPIFFISKNV